MRLGIVLGCLVVASTVVAKDLVFRQRTSTFVDQTPDEETIYVTADKVVTEFDLTRTIIDFERRTIITVDGGARTYTEIGFDEHQAQMDALRGLVDQMKPGPRMRLDALFDDGGAVTLEPTGKTATAIGYPTREYALTSGQYAGFVWTTEAIEKPAAFTKWKSLEKIRGGAARRLADAMAQAPGFPLRAHIAAKAADQAIAITIDVLDVLPHGAPPKVLTVPPTFTKRGAPGPSPKP
jgi:hypothetical protein